MGLYFRKSLKLGPLPLNLSKSGLGASVGVKGARVGVDVKGNGYVAGGRGGVYFRETLPTSTEPSDAPPQRSLGLPWIILVAFVLGLLMTGAILGGM
jgi:hypothetical protein